MAIIDAIVPQIAVVQLFLSSVIIAPIAKTK